MQSVRRILYRLYWVVFEASLTLKNAYFILGCEVDVGHTYEGRNRLHKSVRRILYRLYQVVLRQV